MLRRSVAIVNAQSGSTILIATSFSPTLASMSPPMRTSQPSSTSAPAASAWPVLAATTGTDEPYRRWTSAPPSATRLMMADMSSPNITPRSKPAENLPGTAVQHHRPDLVVALGLVERGADRRDHVERQCVRLAVVEVHDQHPIASFGRDCSSTHGAEPTRTGRLHRGSDPCCNQTGRTWMPAADICALASATVCSRKWKIDAASTASARPTATPSTR